MKIDFFTLKATLERCSNQDIYDKNGYFKENLSIFLKDNLKQKFIGFYKVPNDYPLMLADEDYWKTKSYWNTEISALLYFGQLFKLSLTHRDVDFHFNLVVKTAIQTDFFDVLKNLKYNLQYYLKSDDGYSIIGPYTLNYEMKDSKILELIEKRKIFILSTKQTFEPYFHKKIAS
jgi:hypothetical protein